MSRCQPLSDLDDGKITAHVTHQVERNRHEHEEKPGGAQRKSEEEWPSHERRVDRGEDVRNDMRVHKVVGGVREVGGE